MILIMVALLGLFIIGIGYAKNSLLLNALGGGISLAVTIIGLSGLLGQCTP